ncbi:hypothetical protein [Rhodosalinus sp.]|uniref:hypothetical protein n=1 Tax=Rhodosalinus sp. TaxID=2047741 RepID=UPI0039795EBC
MQGLSRGAAPQALAALFPVAIGLAVLGLPVRLVLERTQTGDAIRRNDLSSVVSGSRSRRRESPSGSISLGEHFPGAAAAVSRRWSAPAHVDLAVERRQAKTGRKAILDGGGWSFAQARAARRHPGRQSFCKGQSATTAQTTRTTAPLTNSANTLGAAGPIRKTAEAYQVTGIAILFRNQT